MTMPASSPVLTALSDALAAAVADVAPSVVAVRAGRSCASGFVWRAGLIVTADEALGEDDGISVVLPGGETVKAQLAGRDPCTGIALLRVDRPDLKAVPLAAAGVMPGALALVVGAEAGSASAALGIVAHAAGPWRSLRGGEIDARIEIAVSLRRRAEGGVVADAGGRVLGMAVFGPRRRVLVIPAATIERTAARLDAYGRIARGYLGLSLHPVAVDGDRARGAIVMAVDPSGPGAAAGICQGDVVVGLNGEPIAGVRALLGALGPDSIGRTVAFGLLRAGAPVSVTLTVAERPPA